MGKYLIRLDDACERMDIEKWGRMEQLLDLYNIKPIVGVIPRCEDPMMNCYEKDDSFWEKVLNWREKKWEIAMHGFNHFYVTNSGGINPVNKKSEFAGLDLETQKKKIKEGFDVFQSIGLLPRVFFAPAHTFDKNTIEAIKTESPIRIISDTIAWSTYCEGNIIFIPQQVGRVRRMPFAITTFCYHPNTMTDSSFSKLSKFLSRHSKQFVTVEDLLSEPVSRRKKTIDRVLSGLYYYMHKT